MTIEQLAAEATDEENFSHDGEVLVELADGNIVSVSGARYDEAKKELVLTATSGSVSRQDLARQ